MIDNAEFLRTYAPNVKESNQVSRNVGKISTSVKEILAETFMEGFPKSLKISSVIILLGLGYSYFCRNENLQSPSTGLVPYQSMFSLAHTDTHAMAETLGYFISVAILASFVVFTLVFCKATWRDLSNRYRMD